MIGLLMVVEGKPAVSCSANEGQEQLAWGALSYPVVAPGTAYQCHLCVGKDWLCQFFSKACESSLIRLSLARTAWTPPAVYPGASHQPDKCTGGQLANGAPLRWAATGTALRARTWTGVGGLISGGPTAHQQEQVGSSGGATAWAPCTRAQTGEGCSSSGTKGYRGYNGLQEAYSPASWLITHQWYILKQHQELQPCSTSAAAVTALETDHEHRALAPVMTLCTGAVSAAAAAAAAVQGLPGRLKHWHACRLFLRFFQGLTLSVGLPYSTGPRSIGALQHSGSMLQTCPHGSSNKSDSLWETTTLLIVLMKPFLS
eukprot:1146616-Pelagomonas_calceolata.AAC.2